MGIALLWVLVGAVVALLAGRLLAMCDEPLPELDHEDVSNKPWLGV